jgi:hypothetical protein
MNMVETFEQRTRRDVYFRQLDLEVRELLDEETGLLSPEYSSVVPCPLCIRKGDFEKLLIRRGYTFVRCPDCGLVFTNPQVDAKKLKDLYKEAKSNEMWIDVFPSTTERGWRSEYIRNHLEPLGKLLGRKGSLLDIGCSVGLFIELARDQGWRTTGLELGEKASIYAR